MSTVLKFVVLLLVAAVLAIGARAMYISSITRQAAPDPEVRVRIAAADLPAGLLVRDSDLDWQTMSRSSVPSKALREGAGEDFNGALLRHRVTAGQILKETDMIRPDTPGFLAAALKPGMLAVSVPVDDVSGNAGLIQPGDYVDMILTQQLAGRSDFPSSGAGSGVVSETVVKHARVIAVGSSFRRDTESAGSSRARTVTIEVEPRIAEAVTVASQLGSLSMALRSFATTERENEEGVLIDNQGASVVAWGQQSGDNDADSNGGPVWGSDISRVLAGPGARQPQQKPQADSAEATPQASPTGRRTITIMRGPNTQEKELPFYVP